MVNTKAVMSTKLRMMRSFVLGCLLLLALTAGTARASLLSGFKGLDSMKESLAVAADELEVELRKAQETFQAGKPSLSLSSFWTFVGCPSAREETNS